MILKLSYEAARIVVIFNDHHADFAIGVAPHPLFDLNRTGDKRGNMSSKRLFGIRVDRSIFLLEGNSALGTNVIVSGR